MVRLSKNSWLLYWFVVKKTIQEKKKSIGTNTQSEKEKGTTTTRIEKEMFSNQRFVTLWYHFWWSAVTLPVLCLCIAFTLNEKICVLYAEYTQCAVRFFFSLPISASVEICVLFYVALYPFLFCVERLLLFFSFLSVVCYASGQWFSSIRSIYFHY